MKILLLGLLFCPLFLLGQNVEKVDASAFAKSTNLGTITVTNADSSFGNILSLLKHHGLDFDRIDKSNGIITTRARIMKKIDMVSYSLKVYLEKNEIQIRVFVTEETGKNFDFVTGTKWYQAQNRGTRAIQSYGFKYLVYFTHAIGEAVKGKVDLSEEVG